MQERLTSPPEQRDAYLESRKAGMLAALAEEGCIEFAFSADLADPGRVRLFELWESREALDKHLAPMRAAGAPPQSPIPVISREVATYETPSAGPAPI